MKEGTKSIAAYSSDNISERHRHRFEFNNEYRDVFEDNGMIFSGTSPDNHLVEMIELDNHPWYVAAQFHPESKVALGNLTRLFRDFVKASIG